MKIAFLSHLDMNLYMFRLPIMQHLVKSGHKVFAITPKGEFFDKFAEFGIEAIEYKIDRASLNPFKELITIYNIYKTIKDLNLDILHSFTAKPNIYGAIASKFAKIPVSISTVTGLGSYYISENKKAKIVRSVIENLYKVAFNLNLAVIFQNGDDLNLFVEHNILDKSKAFLVRSSGIDTEKFSPREQNLDLKNSLNLKSDDIVVLMVARAIVHKGINEYIQASEILSKKHKNIKFILVGGVDNGNISSLTKEYLEAKKSIIYLGERSDIADLISICDIFTLPSYREGVPRTLLEASAMAKAIVTTDTVGCREVVTHNVNGFLVQIKNSEVLADRIEDLTLDRALRERFGSNSRIKALNEFDVKVVVSKYVDIYNYLLNNG